MRPIFKCHGGKYYQWKHIVGHFPKNYADLTYIEPYIGGGSVLLNKTKSKFEIINDLDPSVIAIWKAIQNDVVGFADNLLNAMYSSVVFDLAKNHYFETLGKTNGLAINEYILRRMSRGGLGKSFAWSKRKRGGQPGDINAWESSIMQLGKVYSRIVDTRILNTKALIVIKNYDNPNALFYLDPPYLDETRVSKKAYKYEMTYDEHEQLLKLIVQCSGKILISGYPSWLYEHYLTRNGWRRIEKQIVNHSSQQKHKPIKKEILWINH